MNLNRLGWLVLFVLLGMLLLLALLSHQREISPAEVLQHLEWILPVAVRLASLD